MACIPYGTTKKQEAVFSHLSMYGLVPLGALDSHSMCGSCSPEAFQKKSYHPSSLFPWLWLLFSMLVLARNSVVGTDDRAHLWRTFVIISGWYLQNHLESLGD